MTHLFDILLFAGLCLILGNVLLLCAFRKPLGRLWREPVFSVPVVIFESDDWGPGPAEQASALARLRTIFARYADQRGHHPVMTLGLTLAAPRLTSGDAASARADYERTLLDAKEYADILREIKQGVREGVFAAQLHGMEHFCPAVLLDVAGRDVAVRDWLNTPDQYTESLPDHLQSRWLDARVLPSREHPEAEVQHLVAEEVAAFTHIFGEKAAVVVPPTFVWTPTVEKAWAERGLKYLVTCGTRFVGRDARGALLSDGTVFRNGEVSNGLTVLVRDCYFEPIKGHWHDKPAGSLKEYRACGRPLLIETHRSNFTLLNPDAEAAFAEIDKTLEALLARCRDIRFLSTEELGDAIVRGDPELIASGFRPRLLAWLQRILRFARFRRFARFTGAMPFISLLLFLLRRGWTGA